MKAADSRRGRASFLAGACLVVGVAVVWLGTGSSEEPDAAVAVPETEPTQTSAPRSATQVREMSIKQDGTAGGPEDAAGTVQSQEEEPWSLLRVPLACTVEPALAGAAVVGKLVPHPGTEPDDGAPPSIPSRVTLTGADLMGEAVLSVMGSREQPLRHGARLVLPGFAPTELSLLTTGPGQPATCARPVQLAAAGGGVVGTVRFEDGSPAEGAIVAGCGTHAVAEGDGAYFLLPRTQEACVLRARHAPGTAARSEPQEVDSDPGEDLVLDFVVEVPERPDPGVEVFRTDEGEVWVRPAEEVPWADALASGARIVRVGDVHPAELSDEALLLAMVHLDETITIEQAFETEDGQTVRQQVGVSEL